MTRRMDNYDGAWIQGGTARIPARGEPFGGPPLIDDTPPEIKEHLKREDLKEGAFYAADKLAELYGSHQAALAEARKTTTLAGAKGLTERTLKAYDDDVLAAAEAAPTDDARQLFADDASPLRRLGIPVRGEPEIDSQTCDQGNAPSPCGGMSSGQRYHGRRSPSTRRRGQGTGTLRGHAIRRRA